MNNRWTSRCLWSLGSLLSLAGAVSLAWSAIGQLDPGPVSSVHQSSAVAESATVKSPAIVPLEQFSPIWQTDCRQSLDASASLVNAPAGMNIRLVATALENDQPHAVFLDQQQRTVVRTIGEQMDGMRVAAIQSTSVILERQNQRFEVKLPEPASRPSAGQALSMQGRLP